MPKQTITLRNGNIARGIGQKKVYGKGAGKEVDKIEERTRKRKKTVRRKKQRGHY